MRNECLSLCVNKCASFFWLHMREEITRNEGQKADHLKKVVSMIEHDQL